MTGNPTLNIDPVLEHRVRLTIGVLLARNNAMKFSRFKELLDVTDGNLGAQLRKLEDAGYIKVRKTFEGRRPATWYRLTRKGRRAVDTHVRQLRSLLAHYEGSVHE